MSKHMLSINCKGATNKLSSQFDAANIAANIVVATKFATKVGKKKVCTITHCFASVNKTKKSYYH